MLTKFKSFQSICRSTLTIATILLSTLSIFSIPNSPKVQAGAGNLVNLIVNSKTSTDGINWQNEQISNGGNYQQFMCDSQQFNFAATPNMTPKIKGIADFSDGLTIKKGVQFNSHNSQRDCSLYTIKAQGQPVFAYQYSFEYKFASDKKASESARYLVHTGQNGDYDGALYTFTYYNYWNPQKNNWNGWENPNKNNELGGFLAYAIKPEMGVPNVGSLPSLSQSTQTKEFEEIFHFPGPQADNNNKMPWFFVSEDKFDNSFLLTNFGGQAKGLIMDVGLWGKMQTKFKPDMDTANPTRQLKIKGKYNKNKEIIEITKLENVKENTANSVASQDQSSGNQETKMENKTFYIMKSTKNEGFELYDSLNCLQNSVSCDVYNLKNKDLPKNLLQNGNLITGRIRISGSFTNVAGNSKNRQSVFTQVTKIEDGNLSSKSIEIKDKIFYFFTGQDGSVYLEETQNCLFNSTIDSSCTTGYSYSDYQDKTSKFSQIPLSTDPNHPTMPFGKVKISGSVREIIPNEFENLPGPKYSFVEITKVEKINIGSSNQETKVLTFVKKSGSGELIFLDENGVNYDLINIDQNGPIKPPVGGWLDVTKTQIKYKVTGKFEKSFDNYYSIKVTKVEKVN